MPKILLALAFTLALTTARAQNFSRVRIYADAQQLNTLAQLGVCADHGTFKQNTWVETDLSQDEIRIVTNAGIRLEVLIPDVVKHYRDQVEVKQLRAGSACDIAIIDYPKPLHYKPGSMGGYPTYDEIMSDIDSMALLYPALVKPKAAIGTHTTHNGLPLHWIKLSANPMADEAEPEILITALHHAREPASVAQLMYFAWYMLEHYGTDPEITWLLDHTEIYLVPVVNPDGYKHNQLTNPGGGGMWRKNRRNNGDGTYGVDLNRNYSYQFGVSGASSMTGSDVYKGPAAFSEPETQALRDFVLAHQFKMALNYHAFGNLLLYPYGYGYVNATDKNYFEQVTGLMVCQNGFSNIQAVNLYPAAGDSDDWMYGDTVAKPRVLAMTPEIGSDAMGFWPPAAQIQPICRANMFQNITALHLLHYYCRAVDAGNTVYRNPALSQYFKFSLQKLGLGNVGTSTVSLIPLSPYVTATGPAKTYTNIGGYVIQPDSISFTLAPGVPQGAMLRFVLQTTNAAGVVSDTVTKYYGTPVDVFNSDFTSLLSFTNSGFANTNLDYVSPAFSLTDSPGGNYAPGVNKTITTGDIIIPSTAVFAQVRYYAKWEIEQGFDYAQVLISNDNGASYTPLCGRYTKTGTANQDAGEQLYDGEIHEWVLEEINLNSYIGQTIRLRVKFKSDPGVQMDGFYMDDFEVEIINVNGLSETDPALPLRLWPNPATGLVHIQNEQGFARYEVCDIYGRRVAHGALQAGNNTLNMHGLEDGNYIISCFKTNGTVHTGKIAIMK